jgi:Fe-S oxidoreductase
LVLGKDNLKAIIKFKKEVDPRGLLNPGKVFPPSLETASPLRKVNWLIRLGKIAMPGLIMLRKLFPGDSSTDLPVHPPPVSPESLERELEWNAHACAGCGYCRSVCTEFNVFGWESASPRGKYLFARDQIRDGAEMDERMADMFFMCATCRRCDEICQVHSPILADWDLTIRPHLWEKKYNLPIHFQGTTENVTLQHNPQGHPHEKRMDWVTAEIRYKNEGELGYWVGCTASYAMKPLATNPLRILNRAGVEPVLFGSDEWCCGCDMMLYGRFDDIMETVRHNIEVIHNRGVKTLVTHCPGCWSSFKLYYPILAKRIGVEYGINVLHITETMAELVAEGRIKPEKALNMKVTYHDSCHIGRRGGIYAPPRTILSALPGVEVVEMPQTLEDAPCCGRQLFAYTDIGPKPYVDRAVEAAGTGAAALVTNCPGCQVAYLLGAREANVDLEVLDITDLVAASMDLPVMPSKTIARMARQAYSTRVKPKIQKEEARARSLFSPTDTTYPRLSRDK